MDLSPKTPFCIYIEGRGFEKKKYNDDVALLCKRGFIRNFGSLILLTSIPCDL
jgi:hypothetical protein